MEPADRSNALALVITGAAATKARAILAARDALDGGALRIFVSGGPPLGFRYGLAVSRRVDEGDLEIRSGGVRVVVDYGSAELLTGSELDYVEDGETAGFTILNPAGLHACGGVP